MVRRKSDATPKAREPCAYHEQMQAERANQRRHEARQLEYLSSHDQDTPCWCCCDDCTDLTWYYTPRSGWWPGKDDDVRTR